MTPITEPIKPLTKQEISNILNSKNSTIQQKKLVNDVLEKVNVISTKHNINKNRLYPVVDFGFNTSYVWLD